MLTRRLLPLALALGLFTLNNLPVLSGWIETPEGYVHLMRVNATDNSIYESWLRSSESRVLHPNYQAPWLTEPAVFKPFLLLVARLSRAVGLPLAWGWLLAHLGLYVLAAYALWAAMTLFLTTAKQRRAALGVMVLAIPIPGLLVLPSLLLPLEPLGVPPLPGIGFFVWHTSDGFFHGIAGSILVTYGTAMTLVSFAFLAAYMRTEKRRYLIGAGVSVILCGLVHPYEPFLILSAGSLALLIWRGTTWRRSVPEVVALNLVGGLGMVPMATLALLTPWVRDAAAITRWVPPHPFLLPVVLGVPATVAILLFLPRRRMASPTDLLLQSWIATALIGIYLPFIPWTQHFLDGLHYGVAMLVVRQVAQTSLAEHLWTRHRRLGMAALTTLLVLSVSAYAAYHRQSWKDGRAPAPERLFTSVMAEDDVAVRDWLAENAEHTDLVLAPVDRATWFSTVPMHSFAGNRLFSITFEEQERLSDDFFSGRMDPAEADRFLSAYGIRWVLLREGTPVPASPSGAMSRARVGRWTILELEGNTMKPYPGLSR